MSVAAVFPVRESTHPAAHEELRYTLRSIEANCPWVSDVIITGWLPEWCHNVHHIPTRQAGRKWGNATDNILAACLDPDTPARFAWWNDDFICTKPTDLPPAMHRGTVDKVYAHYRRKLDGNGIYLRGMRATAALLASMGFDDPLSYELHMPMLVERDLLRDCIATLRAVDHGYALHTRTFYGNVANIGGIEVDDVKVIDPADEFPTGSWISTTDPSFKASVGQLVRWLFPTPSRYEITP